MTRQFASRYWSSLTGRAVAPAPRERGRAGYGFWRRYLAALLGVSLPLRTAPPRRRKRAPAQRSWGLAIGLSLAMAFGGLTIVFASWFGGSGPPDGALAVDPSTGEPTVGGTETGLPSHGTVGATPPRPPALKFDGPDTVPRCKTLTGTGARPDKGAAILLVTRPDGLTYYDTTLVFTDTGWAADAQIGTEADAGQRFELNLYAVTPEDAASLSEGEWITEEPGGWLGSTTVTRTAEPGTC